MLQSDRGTDSENRPPARLTPTFRRIPTDPDLTKPPKILYSSHPDKLLSDEFRLKRTRTGSLNEKLFRIPYVEITSADYCSYNDIFVNDIDTSLLSPRQCLDPYTPESIDSHSPDVVSFEEQTEIIDAIDLKTKLSRGRSVSPTQLKNRLHRLLNESADVPKLQRLDSKDSCKSDSSRKGLCCLALKCYGFCRRVKLKCSCFKCT